MYVWHFKNNVLVDENFFFSFWRLLQIELLWIILHEPLGKHFAFLLNRYLKVKPLTHNLSVGFPGGKNLPANTGEHRNVGSISKFGRSPGGGMATHSSIFAWEIPWTGEPGRLQSTGLLRVGKGWAIEHNLSVCLAW